MTIQKNILSGLLCLSSMLYMGCTSHTQSTTTCLLQAETLVWTAPDSSLHLLQSIPEPEKLTGKTQADYALLLSHAQYRCNIPVSSDSLINIALSYYGEHSDKDKQGKAWYMKGSIIEECGGELADALIAYKKAESCVPQMKDKQLVSRLYSRLGILNDKTHNQSLATNYFHKALEVNTEIGNKHSQVSNLINLFNVYFIIQNSDSTLWSLNKLEEISTLTKDSALLAKVYHTLALGKEQIGDSTQTEKLLLQSLHLTSHNPSPRTLSQLAKLYLQNGQKEKADSLYHYILNVSNLSIPPTAYTQLYREAKANKDYVEAIRLADLLMRVQEDYYLNSHQEKALEIQKRYDNMKLLYQNSRLENRIYIIVLGFLLIAGCAVYAFRYYVKQTQQKYSRLQFEVITLQNTLSETDYQNNLHQQELHKQLEEKRDELDAMNKRMKYMYGAHAQLLHPDKLRAMQTALAVMANRTCDLSKDRANLRHWLNLSRNNFTTRLSQLSPSLKEHHIDICCLLVLGLSMDEVSQVMNVNIRTIERYMSQICIDQRCDKRGKTGFMEFLNSFIMVGK